MLQSFRILPSATKVEDLSAQLSFWTPQFITKRSPIVGIRSTWQMRTRYGESGSVVAGWSTSTMPLHRQRPSSFGQDESGWRDVASAFRGPEITTKTTA